jgi:hypothetical protein
MSTLAPALLTARYERQIVKAFRARSALSGPTAQRLRDLGLKDSPHLQGMVTATILRKAGPERFFLHEATWAAKDHMSWQTVRKLAISAVILVAVIAIYLWLR